MLRITLITIALLCSGSSTQAQFLDHLTNPTTPVTLTHPPRLGLDIERIAFGPASGECADELVDALTSHFVGSQVEVIDRQNLEVLLAEHDLAFSGYVDAASATQLGGILGPSALVFIKTPRCTTETNQLYETRSRYNPRTKQSYKARLYISQTRAFLKASIQTVDLASG